MPARLDRLASKRDLRIFDEDYDFLVPYLANHNTTFTEWARDLIHRAANVKRKELGIPET